MIREHLIEKRKLNNNNVDDNKTTGNTNSSDELSNNWLDKWTEQDMRNVWEK